MIIVASSATQRYSLLAEWLRPHVSCWNQSVIQAWPTCKETIPEEWIAALDALPLMQLFQIEQLLNVPAASSCSLRSKPAFLPADFWNFIEPLQELLNLPKVISSFTLPQWDRQGLTPKKQHEIAAVIEFVGKERIRIGFNSAIDIGGGMGHLARNLGAQTGLPIVSIDRNPVLQVQGMAILEKAKTRGITASLRFKTACIEDQVQADIDSIFATNCLSLGLHTCGPLAVHHFKKSSSSRAILNFGCCYDRMTSTHEYRLSRVAKQINLPLSTFSLFLATRGRHRCWAAFEMQQRVNSFRMALHLLLQAEGLCDGFISVGDASKHSYSRSFAEYAEGRYAYLGWQQNFSAARAQTFFQTDSVKKELQKFFVVNMIRNVFARPLELLILFDRAIWLEEQGRNVAMMEFFSYELSPRNIGIYAF